MLAAILKLAGLGGVGGRGWGVLGVLSALLILPTILPGVKASFPWIGTEARLEAALERERETLIALDDCENVNQENQITFNALINKREEQIQEAQQAKLEVQAALDDLANRVRRFEVQANEEKKALREALQEFSQWADVPVPDAVAGSLRRAASQNSGGVSGGADDHRNLQATAARLIDAFAPS